jgi:hypothetical protein
VKKSDQTPVNLRLIVEEPVVGTLYSLQAKDDAPLDPKSSLTGEPLSFDVRIRVGPGPKFFGDQVRREGAERRFVYLRVGQLAGDPSSPWSRRIKIDIHDIAADLLDRAVSTGAAIETVITGTHSDGTPAHATVRPKLRRIAV